ncbi:hypothetical protein NGM10_05785 [Halorussus salilacus]|uniref:hypothetical protein n=1 Tax=Halorussus salilacus TaxID=2953750 RepID=UPI00209DAE31|nr:hypothetical protein [Halorussus salilacus]USZ69247.1 hypothetical protein NGM10_05785 [Halorussus salilacus]
MEEIPPSTVFEIDEESSVAFEIAFSALIATAVLGFPSSGLAYSGLKLIVIGLLVVTLTRWMAVFGQYANSVLVLNRTTHYILSVTYVSILYLFSVLANWITVTLPLELPSVFYLGMSVVMFLLVFIAIQELVFKDLLLYTALLSYNNYQNSDIRSYQKRFERFGRLSLKLSQAEKIPPSLNWLRYANFENNTTIASKWIYYISMGLVVAFFIGLWGTVSLLLSQNIATGVVLFGAIILRTPINFLYSRYGLNPLETELSTKAELASIITGFIYATLLV